MPKIPERWLDYTPIGEKVFGTRFIAFKAPLGKEFNNKLSAADRFTPDILLQQCPSLKLVIDLTNTNRYYNKDDFISKGIAYEKIMCPGQIIPPQPLIYRFFEIVDDFYQKSGLKEALIGIHCTHGVNRTGYFIGRYMVQRMGFRSDKAIQCIEDARGHKIERENFVKDLKSQKPIPSSLSSGKKTFNTNDTVSKNDINSNNKRKSSPSHLDNIKDKPWGDSGRDSPPKKSRNDGKLNKDNKKPDGDRRRPNPRGRNPRSGPPRNSPPSSRVLGRSPPRDRPAGSSPRHRPLGSPPRHRSGGSPPRHRPGGSPPRHRPAGSPLRRGSPPRHRPGGSPPRHRSGGSPPRHRPSGGIPPRDRPSGGIPRGEPLIPTALRGEPSGTVRHHLGDSQSTWSQHNYPRDSSGPGPSAPWQSKNAASSNFSRSQALPLHSLQNGGEPRFWDNMPHSAVPVVPNNPPALSEFYEGASRGPRRSRSPSRRFPPGRGRRSPGRREPSPSWNRYQDHNSSSSHFPRVDDRRSPYRALSPRRASPAHHSRLSPSINNRWSPSERSRPGRAVSPPAGMVSPRMPHARSSPDRRVPLRGTSPPSDYRMQAQNAMSPARMHGFSRMGTPPRSSRMPYSRMSPSRGSPSRMPHHVRLSPSRQFGRSSQPRGSGRIGSPARGPPLIEPSPMRAQYGRMSPQRGGSLCIQGGMASAILEGRISPSRVRSAQGRLSPRRYSPVRWSPVHRGSSPTNYGLPPSNSANVSRASPPRRLSPRGEYSPRYHFSPRRGSSPQRRGVCSPVGSPRSRRGPGRQSPPRRVFSPLRRGLSPQRRASSPHRRFSPRRHSSVSPRRSGPSQRLGISPPRRGISPRNSPPRRVISPRRGLSPQRRGGSPSRIMPVSPKQQRHGISPPRRGFSPPRRGLSPQRRGGSPPRRYISPDRKPLFPSRREFPHERRDSSYPYEVMNSQPLRMVPDNDLKADCRDLLNQKRKIADSGIETLHLASRPVDLPHFIDDAPPGSAKARLGPQVKSRSPVPRARSRSPRGSLPRGHPLPGPSRQRSPHQRFY